MKSSEKEYSNEGNPDVLRFLKEVGKVLDIGCGVDVNVRILKESDFQWSSIIL